MWKYTQWNQPKVGFRIFGFDVEQFLHFFDSNFRKLFKIDIASDNWREVHSLCFDSSLFGCRAPEWIVEQDSLLPSLSSGNEASIGEKESNLLAPTTSPFMMSSNWETNFSTLVEIKNSKKNPQIQKTG